MNLSKLDLKVELSPSQLLRIDGWLEIFYSKCKSRMSDPVIEDGFLKISSVDIYNFLRAIDVNDENQFDWSKLRKAADKILHDVASKKRSSLLKTHYLSCRKLLSEIK